MTDQHDQTRDFSDWWVNDSLDSLHAILPKVTEYGSTDLLIIGETLLKLLPHLQGVVHPRELGIAFYHLGKSARIFGAYVDGHAPSDDTWHDAEIYAKMAKRVRTTGGMFP